MTVPMSPQEIQELAAGYVLGDLTSTEAESFTALLAQMPELQAEVAALQEALAMMPYGLEEEAPAMGLRSQILSAAQAEIYPPLPATDPVLQQRPRPKWVLGALVVALAMGLVTWRSTQVRFAQAPTSELATANGISQTWSGLSQLLNDHKRSLSNPDGPVDFVVQQPTDIPSLLSGFNTTVAALPLLPAKQGMLLGGSNCQLGETAGLRLTYQLATDKTVSAYQLVVKDEEFPEFQAAQLTLQQPDGTGIVLWRDDNYLYALVAEMPTAELQSLAYAIGT
ncbi:anti-sigma factor [Leptothoe kymatousa]|uniref:Anti-sigma factor n=1 Tax=Leptothoe kymatousa TAU-MAC 1615 TaxID=2364775 RepID=A0ABS5Y3C7_9CYAN|nr:hypothetical protein [Leptothoe kymatousa]MBT9312121.1 hypothetical protein [Leptothoe kymatousa TAU-MAC 1615]